MKKIVYAIIILCALAIGYQLGKDDNRGKHYEAACFFKDVINSARCDLPGGKEHYDNWKKQFEEYDFEYLKEEDLENYSYSF